MPDDKGRGVATPLPCVHHSANGSHANGQPYLETKLKGKPETG